MLIPKFSIRQMLISMIGIGLVSTCLAGAARGNSIAFALSVSILGMVIPFGVFAIVHWTAYGLARTGTSSIVRIFLSPHQIPGAKTLDLGQSKKGHDPNRLAEDFRVEPAGGMEGVQTESNDSTSSLDIQDEGQGE